MSTCASLTWSSSVYFSLTFWMLLLSPLFFLATEFKKYMGPNSRKSYGTECQSQMSSCGPLIFGLGLVSGSEVTKVNVSSGMVHGTPVFLEIYQSYGCGVTQCINLALILPPAPPPRMQFLQEQYDCCSLSHLSIK